MSTGGSKKAIKKTHRFKLNADQYKLFRFANMRACFSDCTFSRDDNGIMTVRVSNSETFAAQLQKEVGVILEQLERDYQAWQDQAPSFAPFETPLTA